MRVLLKETDGDETPHRVSIEEARPVFANLEKKGLDIFVIFRDYVDETSACGVAMSTEIDEVAVEAIEGELNSCLEVVLHVLAKPMDETHTRLRS